VVREGSSASRAPWVLCTTLSSAGVQNTEKNPWYERKGKKTVGVNKSGPRSKREIRRTARRLPPGRGKTSFGRIICDKISGGGDKILH